MAAEVSNEKGAKGKSPSKNVAGSVEECNELS